MSYSHVGGLYLAGDGSYSHVGGLYLEGHGPPAHKAVGFRVTLMAIIN